MPKFENGHAKMGGRGKGVRNRLGTAFLEALYADFQEHGAEVIKLARIEKPNEYLRTICATLPKEFELTDSRLKDIPDDELDAIITAARRQLASRLVADAGSGENKTVN